MFFSVWLCVHIRWLEWPRLVHFTSLNQALFSKPQSPSGPTKPSWGKMWPGDKAAEHSKMDTLSLFCFYFLYFFISFLSFYSHVVHSLLSLPRTSSFVFYFFYKYISIYIIGIFWFILFFHFRPSPLPPYPFSPPLQLQLVCGWAGFSAAMRAPIPPKMAVT